MSLYEILGVREDAHPEVIHAAYKALAKTLHPDRNRSAAAAERMKQVNEAYSVLKDPAKRRAYDLQSRPDPFAGFANANSQAYGGNQAAYMDAYPVPLTGDVQQFALGVALNLGKVMVDRMVANLPPELRAAVLDAMKRNGGGS